MNDRPEHATPGAASFIRVAFLLLLWVATARGTARAERDLVPGAPFPSRNLSPARLLFLVPRLEGTDLPERGELQAAFDAGFANYFERHVRGVEEIFLDMEILRLSLIGRYGLTPRLSLGIDLPFQNFTSGFLDQAADAIDDFVGTPSRERKQYGKNRYRYRWISPSGKLVLEPPQHGPVIGDLALSAHYRILRDGGPESFLPALAANVTLKVPTGDRSRGGGSGALDGALGFAVSKPFLKRFWASLDANLVIPSHPESLDGVETGPFVTLAPTLAAGLLGDNSLEALVQLDFEQTPFSKSRLLTLSKDSLELIVGLRYKPVAAVALHVAFTEELIADPSPDFQILAGVSYSWSFLTPAPPDPDPAPPPGAEEYLEARARP